MSFDAYGTSQKESSSNKVEVNWDEFNSYVVETAGLQSKETVAGYVSCIIDLGTQEQPDAEVEFKGNSEDERKAIAEKPATYFKDGKDQNGNDVRLKCWPQKPVQAVAIAADFPSLLVDKGQFFGESNELPLRLWMGGKFYSKGQGKMLMGQMNYLKVNKKLGNWSLAQNSLLYKMGAGAKLVKDGECFLPQQIDGILGQSYLFNCQVFMKKGSDGKKYYTEYIKFGTPLPKGYPTPEQLTTPIMVQFNKENDEDALKQLPMHIINTMMMAQNFEGSKVQEQLVAMGKIEGGSGKKEEEVVETKPDNQAHGGDSAFHEDIPFAPISKSLISVI